MEAWTEHQRTRLTRNGSQRRPGAISGTDWQARYEASRGRLLQPVAAYMVSTYGRKSTKREASLAPFCARGAPLRLGVDVQPDTELRGRHFGRTSDRSLPVR